MRPWSRIALSAVAIAGLAAGMLAAGAAEGAPSEAPLPSTSAAATVSPLDASILKLQADLDRVPGNFRAWADLGLAYVQKARLTADPGFYTRADGAFAKSLELRPNDNDLALTGQASLAASRHDFADALALTDRSLKINGFSATTYAVRSDALTELGRYDEARAAIQRLLDLRPGGVDGFTRASYSFELRGDDVRASELLERATQASRAPADVAFAYFYLGELAWNRGDLTAASAAYEAGLVADPNYMQLVAGRAKVLAARGDTAAAASEYRTAVERLPLPEFLVSYGELLEATGQDDAAAEQYAVLRATQKIYAASGQDVDTELAVFEADHGTATSALASAKKAYAKRPNAIFTQDAYAWALHANGLDAQALPIAKQSIRLGYRFPAFYYRLGAIALAAGDRTTAKAALTKALALNPEFSPLHAPKARALLRTLE